MRQYRGSVLTTEHLNLGYSNVWPRRPEYEAKFNQEAVLVRGPFFPRNHQSETLHYNDI